MPPRVIALIGLRCVGKTTIGRALAVRLGWQFADGDALLSAAVGKPAGEWLVEVGEEEFRRREAAVMLPLLASARDTVIATGGGAVTIPAVRQALGTTAVFPVWLMADTDVLVRRSAAAAVVRPALTPLLPGAEWDELRRRREPLYAALARFSIDTSATSVAACVAAIVAAWQRHEPSGS